MPIVAELRARPLVLFALAIGFGLGFRCEPWLLVLLIPLLLLAEQWWQRGVIGVVGLIGVWNAPTPVKSIFEAKPIDGLFVVRTVPRITSQATWAIVEQAGVRYVLKLEPDRSELVSLGDRVGLKGTAHPLREGTDAYWTGRGVLGSIAARADARPAIEVVSRGPAIFRWGMGWRASFMKMTDSSLPPDDARLMDALCFNVDSTLSDEFRDDLRRTGVIHIVSASGLHVMVFAYVLQLAFRRLPVGRPIQLIILLAILLLYAGATGFRPPVIRAVVMSAMMLGAYLLGKEGDLLSAAGFAAFSQLLLDPWAVFDIGFYLSFVTVAGLALYMPKGIPKKWRDRTLRSIQASAIATIAAAPIVGYAFGTISIVGIVANLLIEAAILPMVAGGLLVWPIWLLSPGVGEALLRGLVVPASAYVHGVVERLGSLPFATIDVPPYPAWLIPAFYVACLLGWRFTKRSAE